jgi:DNA-directed RNA polymerase specialized sigma24 family protein
MVKLYKAIYLLEEDKRDLLIDKYINNKKIKEIALERSSTESAIKMQIKRARDSAKKKYLEIHAK